MCACARAPPTGGFISGDLPALWLYAPAGWAGTPRRPALRAESTGGLGLLTEGAGWPPSGVCRSPRVGGGSICGHRVRVQVKGLESVKVFSTSLGRGFP